MMNRFEEITHDIHLLFGSQAWQDNAIKTLPSNFVDETTNEYIRIGVVINTLQNTNNAHGVINIEIFVPSGSSLKRTMQIADMLNLLLGRKLHNLSKGSIQFGLGSLGTGARCPDAASLYRTLYTIPFNFYEVTN